MRTSFTFSRQPWGRNDQHWVVLTLAAAGGETGIHKDRDKSPGPITANWVTLGPCAVGANGMVNMQSSLTADSQRDSLHRRLFSGLSAEFSDWEPWAGEPSQTPGRKRGPCFWTLRGRREKEASFTHWPAPSGPAGLLTQTELTPSIPPLVYRIPKSSGKATSDCTRLLLFLGRCAKTEICGLKNKELFTVSTLT